MEKNLMKIKTIIWIDEKIKNDENQIYLKLMKDKFKIFNIYGCDTLQEGINQLLKIKYELVFVCTSGRLYQSYLQKLKEITDDLFCLPISIIFTSPNFKQVLIGLKENEDSQHPINRETKQLLLHPFYNPGGVSDEYIQVENFLYDFSEKLNELIDTMDDIETDGDIDYATMATKLILKSILSQKNEKLIFSLDEINQCKDFLNEIDYKNTKQPQAYFCKIPSTIMEKYWKQKGNINYEPSSDNMQFSVVELIEKMRDSNTDNYK
jgi:hypothetical protein